MRKLLALSVLLAACGPPAGDINEDGAIDAGDLAALKVCIGADLHAPATWPGTLDCRLADLDGNGTVTATDLGVLEKKLP
jgi:hypothetical protein